VALATVDPAATGAGTPISGLAEEAPAPTPDVEVASPQAKAPIRIREGKPPRTVPGEALLLAVMTALAVPLILSLLTENRVAWLPRQLSDLADQRVFRLTSGLIGAAVVCLQGMLPLFVRFFPRQTRATDFWNRLHRLNGVPLLLAVLLHTGGGGGTHMHRWLLGALVMMLLTAQGGHVLKAYLWFRACPELSPSAMDLWRDKVTNTRGGWFHQAGRQIHVLFATIVIVLLLFHALSVYYF
jgi:cytochrome b561